ncbi:hypothetical protein MNEG_15938 [Monoraphidium neglectum]|uniref:Uncharacterized protein n=1 Tax=Monoraphidium neglectum TaxID=145388 RepID=A0A0D2LJ64_9CHLO|nr:hypothetical protein MNEG_15938 [Monoraphidium neglectum]KIY92024.1 hypothetical protein MNEG_15938 [Monoraphidium neglectum]|eukprot:XP_013891044.1 hypothetical protein MNEG_15938 [Monoraphidium neglectum]
MATDSVWGKPGGAWADDVEEQEQSGTLAAPAVAPYKAFKEEAFPALSAAKEAPKKKGKAKPVPLGAFLGGSAAASARTNLDDKAILLALPKSSTGAPREEGQGGGIGGAFREYGGDRGGARRGGFGDRDREGGGDERPGREPSRADEDKDWGASRKFTPSEAGGGGSRGFGGGGFGGERRGGAGGGERGGFEDRPPRREAGPSAADEADDWGATRKFQPSTEGERRGGGGGFGGGGGGFRDRDGPRDGPRGDGPERRRFDEPSRADTDDWATRRAPPPADDRAAPSARRPGFGFSGSSAADGEDRWARGTGAAPPPSSSGGADAGPARERPRLNLAPRTKPVASPTPGAV